MIFGPAPLKILGFLSVLCEFCVRTSYSRAVKQALLQRQRCPADRYTLTR